MKSCGLIVEYNPLHNGHIHHIQKAKEISQADCIIAIMSGPFLQRGEPAIIDKFYRTRAAIKSGADIVLELPYAYAVQSSNLFAKGSIFTLHEMGVSSICFGSEAGHINHFLDDYHTFKANEPLYNEILKENLNRGLSFPQANTIAREKTKQTTNTDLSKPNNILGSSYVQTILDADLPIKPFTIKRKNNDFHQQEITSTIASATSIRKQLLFDDALSNDLATTIPVETIKQLKGYRQQAMLWHQWEDYFLLLHYRVMTMSLKELANIHGVDEGLESRIKQTAKEATSFKQWITLIKTKRYTWTRLQRMFVHILTNTKKDEIREFEQMSSVPYIRLLGFSDMGRKYLRNHKKKLTIPIISQFSRNHDQMLKLDERASNAYYSILRPNNRKNLLKQELSPPIFL